jgi:hypothetical protein
VVEPSPHVEEKRQRLAAMRRLPSPQLGHQRGQVSAAKHGRPGQPPRLMQGLHKAQPSKGLPAGASHLRRHPQNGDNNPIWPLRVQPDAIWVRQRWHDVPEAHGQHFFLRAMCVHLSGLFTNRQPLLGQSLPPHERGPEQAARERPPAERGQVCVGSGVRGLRP